MRWVQMLATREYADELVVMCAAFELAVRITIIPFTPPEGLGQWAVVAHGPEGGRDTIYMGNNDVYDVLLLA